MPSSTPQFGPQRKPRAQAHTGARPPARKVEHKRSAVCGGVR
nr:MAG TPA: hypothetical protein [Caudoviricetes sp.]